MYFIGKICLFWVVLVALSLTAGNSFGQAKEYLPAVGPKPLSIKAPEWRAVPVLPSIEAWAAKVEPDWVGEKKESRKSEEDEDESEEEEKDEPGTHDEKEEGSDRAERTNDAGSVVEEFQYFTRWDDEILRYFLGVDRVGARDEEFRVTLPVSFEPPRPVERMRGRATYRQE